MTSKILFLKLFKFCTVGFSGIIIDLGITYLLKEKIKINRYIASTCGFAVAVSSNYSLNRIWTFGSQNKQIANEYFSFLIIALIGLGINNGILWFLSDRIKLNFYLSKIIAIGIVTLWNFVMNFLFTFANK